LATTRLSMLKPLPAKIPETLDKTPGSFVTKQLRTWRLIGALDGTGVLYKILLTASWAVGGGWTSTSGVFLLRRGAKFFGVLEILAAGTAALNTYISI